MTAKRCDMEDKAMSRKRLIAIAHLVLASVVLYQTAVLADCADNECHAPDSWKEVVANTLHH